MALGARLKELRIQKRQSLQQVADGVGASKAHIWELETGKSSNPSIELLGRLADHFGVTVASLVGEDPKAKGEDPELVAMYREMKGLTEKDRETLRMLMQHMRAQAKKGQA